MERRKALHGLRDGREARAGVGELGQQHLLPARREQEPLQPSETAQGHPQNVDCQPLAGTMPPPHLLLMFAVSEDDAAAIRAAFHEGGEFAAAIELRRRFPGIADNAHARQCARSIAGWSPGPLPSRPATRLRPRKQS